MAANKSLTSVKQVKGVYQWWKKPVYVAPVVGVLEKGPDFSFVDGRRLEFTCKFDLERRQKQVQLGERVVRYLAEIREAEQLHAQKLAEERDNEIHKIQITPRAKGVEEIW